MGFEALVGEAFETLQTHADGGVTLSGTTMPGTALLGTTMLGTGLAPTRECWASQPALPSFARSEIVGGKYKLLRPLGGGGMGRVWVAEHTTLHALVALKFMSPATLQSCQARARFALE